MYVFSCNKVVFFFPFSAHQLRLLQIHFTHLLYLTLSDAERRRAKQKEKERKVLCSTLIPVHTPYVLRRQYIYNEKNEAARKQQVSVKTNLSKRNKKETFLFILSFYPTHSNSIRYNSMHPDQAFIFDWSNFSVQFQFHFQKVWWKKNGRRYLLSSAFVSCVGNLIELSLPAAGVDDRVCFHLYIISSGQVDIIIKRKVSAIIHLPKSNDTRMQSLKMREIYPR